MSAPSPPERKPRRIHIELGEVIVEIVSIVVAILLALAINTWQGHVHDQQLLRSSVVNIVAELRHNRATLAPLAERHARAQAAMLRSVDAPGAIAGLSAARLEHLIHATAPHGFGVIEIQDIAWQIAQQDRALALMPYRQRATLTALYERQQDLRDAYARFIALLEAPATFAPGRSPYALQAIFSAFGDVRGAESDLLAAYPRAIAMLGNAYHTQESASP